MLKRVLIVAATEAEADALKRIQGLKPSPDGFFLDGCEIILLVTGVGSVVTSWAMTKWFSSNARPDLAINIGIAGSFREDILIGEVVVPVSDCFADAGIESGDRFLTLAEAGLEDPDSFPFKAGWINADNRFTEKVATRIRPVKSVTMNRASGSLQTIQKVINKFDPDIETMEGATFFYICSREELPFLALRSISNKVEPRNKERWNIPLAISNLSEKLEDILLIIK